MAQIYSILLGRGFLSPGVSETLYTVPASSIVVVRDVVLFQFTGSPSLAACTDSAGAHVAFSAPAVVPGGDHWEGRQVFNAGEDIVVGATDGNWTYAVSGYLLST